MKRNIVWTVFFFATLLLSLGVAASAQQAAGGTPGNPTLFETRYQVNEIIAYFPVDLAVARHWVPPVFNLAVDAQGNATGALVFMNCPNYFFLTTPNAPPLEAGENLAPIGVVHFWLILQAPAQVLPVPGALVTAPTGYAYDVATLLSNPVAVTVFRRAGRNAVLISGLTFVDEGQKQTGEITFLNGSKITLNASTPVQFPAPLRLGANIMNWHVAGRHAMDDGLDVQVNPAVSDPTNVNTTRVQVLGLVPGPPNSTQVTIDAEPGTLFADYYGTSHAVSSRATFFRLNNVVNNSSRCELGWTTYPPTPIPVPPALP
jgi:hypothetical protein